MTSTSIEDGEKGQERKDTRLTSCRLGCFNALRPKVQIQSVNHLKNSPDHTARPNQEVSETEAARQVNKHELWRARQEQGA